MVKFYAIYHEISSIHTPISRGCDRMVVGCCEFESQTGKGVQHYVIKFASDLQQVDGFSPGTPVSSTNKTDCHDITELLLKVALTRLLSFP